MNDQNFDPQNANQQNGTQQSGSQHGGTQPSQQGGVQSSQQDQSQPPQQNLPKPPSPSNGTMSVFPQEIPVEGGTLAQAGTQGGNESSTNLAPGGQQAGAQQTGGQPAMQQPGIQGNQQPMYSPQGSYGMNMGQMNPGMNQGFGAYPQQTSGMPAPASGGMTTSAASGMPTSTIGGMPMGGFPPPPPGAGAQGMGGGFDGYGGQEPPQDPALIGYKFGDANKNFRTNIKIPQHQLKFNELYFMQLLAGSISLTKDEKYKIVQSVPKLRQEQVDELIHILEEEKEKFVELSPKHAAQLKKLEEQHLNDWKDLEVREQQSQKKAQDQAKADEIRKSLGL